MKMKTKNTKKHQRVDFSPIAIKDKDFFFILLLTYMKKDLFFFYDCVRSRRAMPDFCEKRSARNKISKITFNRMKGGIMK